MRWFWIDRYTEFVSGESAVAVKCVSLSEDATNEYAPGRTYCPTSGIIEGFAQAGGLLVSQITDFHDRVVLAKIAKSKFYFEAYPGETITFRLKLVHRDGIGSRVAGTTHIGDRLQGEIELMFASLDDDRFATVELFEPAEFCRMIRMLRMFEVGVNPDGSPIKVPEHMLDAEKAYLKLGC